MPRPTSLHLPRRRLLTGAAALAALAALPAHAALAPTPRQTAGPFYPPSLPAEHDRDLVRVSGSTADALGQVTYLEGRVLDLAGDPVPGALVEIWQCDANGVYHHPADRRAGRDPRFQGYGRTLSDGDGRYGFRTIRPVAYPGRTPHIHVAVSGAGLSRLTTQLYVAGEPANGRDFLYGRLSAAERAAVTVAFVPAPAGDAGALSASFDLVVARA